MSYKEHEFPKIGRVYVLYNVVSKRHYVGSTFRMVSTRVYEHLCKMWNGTSKQLMNEDFNAYGRNSFKHEILFEGEFNSFSELWSKEEEFTIKFKEAGKELYNGRFGNSPDENERELTSKRFKNKPKSEEQRKRMSEVQMGEKNHMYGKHLSEEAKAKLSESLRATFSTPEMKAKLSKVNTKWKNSCAYRCLIGNELYPTFYEIHQEFKISNSEIRRRCESPKFPNWQHISKDEYNNYIQQGLKQH